MSGVSTGHYDGTQFLSSSPSLPAQTLVRPATPSLTLPAMTSSPAQGQLVTLPTGQQAILRAPAPQLVQVQPSQPVAQFMSVQVPMSGKYLSLSSNLISKNISLRSQWSNHAADSSGPGPGGCSSSCSDPGCSSAGADLGWSADCLRSGLCSCPARHHSSVYHGTQWSAATGNF